MTRPSSIGVRFALGSLLALAGLAAAGTAGAQQPPPPIAVPPPAPEAAPASTAMSTPSMAGPLVANPNPYELGETIFGKLYLTGAVSGLALLQSNAIPGDSNHIDINNGHLIVQSTEGMFQSYLQVGAYSFPAVGAAYVTSGRTTGGTFGPVPVVNEKIAFNDAFNVQFGKLPTLFGAEYAFTFQNMNIERGLLWNQEPIVSRGIQLNYAADPWTLALSINDGFYSDAYNWISGSLAYAINKMNTVSVVAGGNVDHTSRNSFSSKPPFLTKTPFFPNNGQIVNLIYTYNNAPWTITPYFQYTHVPGFGGFPFFLPSDNGTVGVALLANYAITDNINLAGRFEYITSTASKTALAPNLLYGPGSDAWSITVTPTYQEGIFFLRGEGSYVQASSITPGFAFGKAGTAKNQARFLLETGVVF